MQNYDMRGKSEGFQLAKYRWLVILPVVVLAVVVYLICKPLSPRLSTKDLFYEPLGGAWIDDSQGNGDREINPGEQVKVKPRLTNTGRQRLPAFDLVFSTSEPKVALQDNKCHYPASEPGQTVLPEDPFEFKLDSSFVLNCVSFTGKVENVVQAGFVTDAFASNGGTITIDAFVYSNYRMCLGVCTLQQGATLGNPDILTINVALCNSATGNTFSDARMKIPATSIKACGSSSTFTAVLDSVHYGNVVGPSVVGGSVVCNEPPTPTQKFKFSVPSLVPATPGFADTTMCIHFAVKIYSATTLKAELNMGIKARMSFRSSGTPLTAVGQRRSSR